MNVYRSFVALVPKDQQEQAKRMIVACGYCRSTMWGLNAKVDDDDTLVCSGCAKVTP